MKERVYRKKVSYSLPEKTIETLKAMSIKKGINQSVLVQLALEEFFRKEEKVIDVQ